MIEKQAVAHCKKCGRAFKDPDCKCEQDEKEIKKAKETIKKSLKKDHDSN